MWVSRVSFVSTEKFHRPIKIGFIFQSLFFYSMTSTANCNSLVTAAALSRGHAFHAEEAGSQSKIRHRERIAGAEVSLNATHKGLHRQYTAHEGQTGSHLRHSDSIQAI